MTITRWATIWRRSEGVGDRHTAVGHKAQVKCNDRPAARSPASPQFVTGYDEALRMKVAVELPLGPVGALHAASLEAANAADSRTRRKMLTQLRRDMSRDYEAATAVLHSEMETELGARCAARSR